MGGAGVLVEHLLPGSDWAGCARPSGRGGGGRGLGRGRLATWKRFPSCCLPVKAGCTELKAAVTFFFGL